MDGLKRAFIAELLKLKHSNVVWIIFAAFALGPIMGCLMIIILQNPILASKLGIISSKAAILTFSADWNSYFSFLSQVVGFGGIIVFGFVASYLFGREYVDRTARDLLSLPINRTKILNAKFFVYILLCFSLAVSDLILGFILGKALNLTNWEYRILHENIQIYFITTLLALALGTPISFFALWSKGYLAPLGFLVLTLILDQFIAITNIRYYFPWLIPGLYSGALGEFKSLLNIWSYLILAFTCIVGYVLTIFWWEYTDHI